MKLFRNKRPDIELTQAVLDALISLLQKRGIVKRDEIQMEILDRATGGGDGQTQPKRP